MTGAAAILAVNAGSSSIKLGLYRAEQPSSRVLGIDIERIGTAGATMRVVDASRLVPPDDFDGGAGPDEPLPDHGFHAAFERALGAIGARGLRPSIAGVGHRVVHGGPTQMDHQRITPAVLDALRDAIPLARNHLPQALAGIECATRVLPDVPQVACFDTAFHRTMPRVARMHALPRTIHRDGRDQPLPPLERFGFHGLSYEYLCAALAAINPVAARGRLIVLHLGSGASIAAIRDGRSVDTSMGFTPNSGLVMGTRTGDIDPGVLTYLLRETKLPLDALETLLDRQSGLAGVSGSTADMRELVARERDDPRAADAIALFCHRAIKYVGAYASVLGGVDTVIFSGGIGERSAVIRERICAGQSHLGIRIDPGKNAIHAPVISVAEGPVTVRVIHTDEESMIVRHTLDVLGN